MNAYINGMSDPKLQPDDIKRIEAHYGKGSGTGTVRTLTGDPLHSQASKTSFILKIISPFRISAASDTILSDVTTSTACSFTSNMVYSSICPTTTTTTTNQCFNRPTNSWAV